MAFLSEKVRDYRWEKLRRLMRQLRLDAVALSAPDFFQFATNYHVDVQTWERPIVAVLPLEGAPFTVMNELSTNHLRFAKERQTMWLEDVTLYAEHPVTGNRTFYVHQWPELLAEKLSAKGLAKARIGVDAASALFAKTAGLIPGVEFIPMAPALRELRWVKHEEEIQLMREMAALSDWVQDRYRENIRPGRLVQELDFAMAALMVEEGARRFPGENLEVMRCWTLAGAASASPHGNGAPNGARIEAGDVLVNIVIPRLNGLVIENERTWFCGTPSAEQKRYFETARAANEAASEQAVTDNPVAAIDEAARQVIEQAGFAQHILHRTGHGIGVQGHEFPEDMAFNRRPLQANEVYSAEPGIYVYGLGGFRFDDTVVVGTRPEILTKAPKDLASQTV
jgi:Xaa-Pro aminopeptidase